MVYGTSKNQKTWLIGRSERNHQRIGIKTSAFPLRSPSNQPIHWSSGDEMWHIGKQCANITTKRRKIKCLKPPDILRGPACNLIEQICNWHNCRFGKGYLVGKQNCGRNKLGTFTWNHRLAYRGQSVNTLCGIWNNNQSGKQRIISNLEINISLDNPTSV